MQSNIYQNQNNSYNLQRDPNIHEKCQKHLYQLIQVELNDGSVYQGLLHSYDHEKMYLLIPQTEQAHTHHSQMSINIESTSSDNRLFPFFGPFGLYGFPFFGIRRFGPFFPFFF